jgi:hypothetical protein
VGRPGRSTSERRAAEDWGRGRWRCRTVLGGFGGYEHAAIETFHAVSRFLVPAAREISRTWVEDDIYVWRHNSMRGYPPTWRLRMLAGDGLPGASATSASPLLLRLALHCRRIRVLELQPVHCAARAVARAEDSKRYAAILNHHRRHSSIMRPQLGVADACAARPTNAV